MNPVSSNPNQQMGAGRVKYTYVNEDSIPEDLKCKICHCPLQDALIHKECGEMFCRLCIQGHENCPECQVKLIDNDLYPAPSAINNMLDRFMVVCPTCKSSVAFTTAATIHTTSVN